MTTVLLEGAKIVNVSREYSRPLETLTMLIIDEHPTGLDVISGPLEARGLEVVLAQDGAGGLARARDLGPDLVLLGAALPDMDGLEICRQLKASEGVRDAPVIFMLPIQEVLIMVLLPQCVGKEI